MFSKTSFNDDIRLKLKNLTDELAEIRSADVHPVTAPDFFFEGLEDRLKALLTPDQWLHDVSYTTWFTIFEMACVIGFKPLLGQAIFRANKRPTEVLASAAWLVPYGLKEGLSSLREAVALALSPPDEEYSQVFSSLLSYEFTMFRDPRAAEILDAYAYKDEMKSWHPAATESREFTAKSESFLGPFSSSQEFYDSRAWRRKTYYEDLHIMRQALAMKLPLPSLPVRFLNTLFLEIEPELREVFEMIQTSHQTQALVVWNEPCRTSTLALSAELYPKSISQQVYDSVFRELVTLEDLAHRIICDCFLGKERGFSQLTTLLSTGVHAEGSLRIEGERDVRWVLDDVVRCCHPQAEFILDETLKQGPYAGLQASYQEKRQRYLKLAKQLPA